MLSERINLIFTILSCSNSSIAGYAGCDSSHISRMRSGARKPQPNHKSVLRLINGIYGYCEDNNLLHSLCGLCSAPENNEAEIKKCLVLWLFSDSSNEELNKINKFQVIKKTKKYSYFGEKLNAVMNIIELSNVRLGKAVNIDSSHISRFRNGVRTPKANGELVVSIASYLFDRAGALNMLSELARLIGAPAGVAQDNELLKSAFFEWLCTKEDKPGEYDTQLLLESIDTFSTDSRLLLPDYREIANTLILDEPHQYYIGISGLRNAVLRFLVNALKNGATTLFLYSDQSIDWMTENKEFQLKWMSLMSACVAHGIKILIVHSIGRDTSEMFVGIKSWLPLYMSGMIEPYFCRKYLDNRFSHTLFLAPGQACIESCSISGCENNGIYNYYTDEKRLLLFKEQFSSLVNLSDPLVKVYTQSDYSGYRLISERFFRGLEVTALLSSPSICSMPLELLLSILDKNSISDTDKKRILESYTKRKEAYQRAINENGFNEIVPLPSDDDLYQGKVYLNLGTSLSDLKISYTIEDYSKHLNQIIKQIDSCAKYHFYPLTESPYTNMHLIIDDTDVLIIKDSKPCISFFLSNSLMNRAFFEYLDKLCIQNKQDRNEIKRILIQKCSYDYDKS